MNPVKILSEPQRRTADSLEFVFKGGKTKRFHTADTLTSQTVGEHSFGVAWLVLHIYPDCRKDLLLAALAHDLAEHQVGDVSSVAKRRYPALKTAVDTAEYDLLKLNNLEYESGLTDGELRVLKLADLMEGMLFCIRERTMGSKMAVEIYNNFYSYVKTAGTHVCNAAEVLEVINHLWEKANVS